MYFIDYENSKIYGVVRFPQNFLQYICKRDKYKINSIKQTGHRLTYYGRIVKSSVRFVHV